MRYDQIHRKGDLQMKGQIVSSSARQVFFKGVETDRLGSNKGCVRSRSEVKVAIYSYAPSRWRSDGDRRVW